MRDAKGFTQTEAVNEALRCLQCVDAYCTKACPADVDARGFIEALSTGNMTGAIRKLKDHTIFPLTCALVCPVERLCEGACCSSELTYPIMISRLQRYIAEQDLAKGYYKPNRAEANNVPVAVVGAGPAGMAAAAELALKGYKVTVFERTDRPGGLLTGGIPPYRLDGEVGRKEADYILSLGVELRTGVNVESVDELQQQGFKAVVLAVGLWGTARLNIPGEEGPNVLMALPFLHDIAAKQKYETPVGKDVLVIGGGSVAMDAAGCARRCGAQTVHVLCLEAPNEMPATHEEINWGWEEGAILHYRAKPLRIIHDGDNVRACVATRIHWKEPGKYIPSNAVEEHGTEFNVRCDTVIVAIGQRPDDTADKSLLADLKRERGKVVVDPESLMTSREGVFAAGDIGFGHGMTVVKAVHDGQTAARGVDQYLRAQNLVTA
jgi:glutamate synthase (NADPH/NADH) small chain